MYVVYEIECKPKKKKYFGRSQEVEKRWRSHINMLRTKSHYNEAMQFDWSKYGETQFSFNILYEFDKLEEAIESEQTHIDEFRDNSYNIANSISGGDTFTFNPRKEEIREIHRQQSIGKNNPMYGKPKNEYTIKRIKETNSKVIKIDGVIYSSISAASKVLGVKETSICYRLKSKSDRFKNWGYVDKEMPNDYRNHA